MANRRRNVHFDAVSFANSKSSSSCRNHRCIDFLRERWSERRDLNSRPLVSQIRVIH
jgi:hypothetical protein